MLLTPHQRGWRFLGDVFYVRPTEQELPPEMRKNYVRPTPQPTTAEEFLDDDGRYDFVRGYDGVFRKIEKPPPPPPGGYKYPYVPDWCGAWRWFPVFWVEDENPVLWLVFVGQTIFVGVLAAVVVNIPRRGNKKRE
jgi:hypothetical protein